MAMIVGKRDELPPLLYVATTPETLRRVLDSHGLSVRGLAARLDVSPMWVSRRARGEVPISPEDTEKIRDTLMLMVRNHHPRIP